MTQNGTEFVGWTGSPDGRGTYDIILSCLITTFLCCWTSVYTNIPAPDDGFWATFRDKLGLACLGLLGPDFTIVLAIGQRSSARRSVRKFREAGYKKWTITHAFFADMGGFVLKAPDLPRPIPLNAEQVFYLVQNRYIAYPETTLAELKDRDKSDGLARLVTVCQATWFVVNFIVRIVQGLFVTTMELTTVTFVVILFGTAWCWIDKPSDVTTTITLETLPRVTMDGITFHGGPRASQPYHQTPFEFVSRDETALNLVWQYYNELVRKFLFSPFSRRVDKVPWDRVPGDVFLRMDFDLELIGVVFIFVFSSIFLAAWNFDFPTTVERDLWRASSIYMVAYGALGALWMELSMWIFVPQSRAAEGLLPSMAEEAIALHPVRKWHQALRDWWKRRPLYRKANADSLDPRPTTKKGGVFGFLSRSHNISPNNDPYMGVPIGFLIVTSVLCSCYCVFRTYILVEDFVGLRSLPPSAYETVTWTSLIPHI